MARLFKLWWSNKLALILALVILFLVVATLYTTFAAVPPGASSLYACAARHTKLLHVVKSSTKCPKGEQRLVWQDKPNPVGPSMLSLVLASLVAFFGIYSYLERNERDDSEKREAFIGKSRPLSLLLSQYLRETIDRNAHGDNSGLKGVLEEIIRTSVDSRWREEGFAKSFTSMQTDALDLLNQIGVAEAKRRVSNSELVKKMQDVAGVADRYVGEVSRSRCAQR